VKNSSSLRLLLLLESVKSFEDSINSKMNENCDLSQTNGEGKDLDNSFQSTGTLNCLLFGCNYYVIKSNFTIELFGCFHYITIKLCFVCVGLKINCTVVIGLLFYYIKLYNAKE
jgi:hypothetical protein